jgi:two-component system sensor histidine kinase CpxA
MRSFFAKLFVSFILLTLLATLATTVTFYFAQPEQMTIVERISNATPPPFVQRNKKIMRIAVIGMIFMAAIGCYLLARSLTAPIRDLRNATGQITKGDFSARVDLPERGGDEITALGHDFNLMAEKTENLLQSQRRLLRDISHELRSPLTRQKMAIELARQHCADADLYLARIEKESDRINELIGQLLMLTRVESEVDVTGKEGLDLQTLVSAIAEDADFEAMDNDCRINIQQLDDVMVLGSREMLGRAFENVIRNGLRYSSTGCDVEVRVVKSDKQAIVTVRDHGHGVPEQCLEQIFKPFFRVAESRDRKSGGTGIGLAIAKQAMLTHGGDIKAENAEDGGLLITMSLPTV